MTFFVIFFALLVERFFDWSHIRIWSWYRSYEALFAKAMGHMPFLGWGATVAPFLIVILILDALLNGVLYGLVELLFKIAVFIYCLGPRNLWVDTYASINAIEHDQPQEAAQLIDEKLEATRHKKSLSLHKQFLHAFFAAANHRVLSVFFWFALLGPAGAVLYRLAAVSAYSPAEGGEEVLRVKQDAKTICGILEWLTIRVFSILFALGGNFAQVVKCWRKKLWCSIDNNDELLLECSMAALGEKEIEKTADNRTEKYAVSLLDRVLIIAVVLVALISFY